MPGSFFDTDVLVYIASSDRVKADKAEEDMQHGLAIEGRLRIVNPLHARR